MLAVDLCRGTDPRIGPDEVADSLGIDDDALLVTADAPWGRFGRKAREGRSCTTAEGSTNTGKWPVGSVERSGLLRT